MLAFTVFPELIKKLQNLQAAPAQASAEQTQDDPAHALMERAEACAGRDPHAAHQLRAAACAYLHLVR